MAVDTLDSPLPASLTPMIPSEMADSDDTSPSKRPHVTSSTASEPDQISSHLNDALARTPTTAEPSFLAVFPRYIRNNYSRRYQMDQRPGFSEDLCVLMHINKLCVIVLAPSHPIVSLSKECVRVSYADCDGSDRTQSHGQGSRKKGAQFIDHGSMICRVECADSSSYDIVSGIRGKLLEVNTTFSTQPALLTSRPFSLGYLAIIMPNTPEMDVIRNTLIDEPMFCQLRKL